MLISILNHSERASVLDAISSGAAVRIDEECFVDGLEDEYRIEFFELTDGRIVRCEYNRRTTRTYLSYVDGFAIWHFQHRRWMRVQDELRNVASL